MPCPIIIIGSGFSAAAALLHLTAAGMACANIMVIGPRALGAGQAYGCIADEFRLNVRPDLMRLWLDQPDHFAQWALENIDDPAAATSAGAFYRRQDFAAYMAAQLAAISDYGDLTHHHDNVISLTRSPVKGNGDKSWIVTTGAGKTLTGDKIILATGNPDPLWPVSEQPPDDASGLVTTPWRGDWLQNLPTGSSVAIVGAGLTAMDAIHALGQQQHTGSLTVIAPHGKLPPVQLAWQPVVGFDWPVTPLRASGFLRLMRQHLGRGSWNDVAWQERFEELRVNINIAWRALTVADRDSLTRRVGWLWSLARFRAGPQTVNTANRLQKSGQLRLRKGRLTSLSKEPEGWMLKLSGGQVVHADIIVNCTGMGRDGLIAGLIATGVIGATAGNKSIVQQDLRLVDGDGNTHETLFMIGPGTGASLGDVVGSASIARQAQSLAGDIV